MSEATSFDHRAHSSANAQNPADRAAAAMQDTANRMADQGREMQQNVQAVADNLGDAIEKSLRDQPYTTLALAAAVGFVLGAIWKS